MKFRRTKFLASFSRRNLKLPILIHRRSHSNGTKHSLSSSEMKYEKEVHMIHTYTSDTRALPTHLSRKKEKGRKELLSIYSRVLLLLYFTYTRGRILSRALSSSVHRRRADFAASERAHIYPSSSYLRSHPATRRVAAARWPVAITPSAPPPRGRDERLPTSAANGEPAPI